MGTAGFRPPLPEPSDPEPSPESARATADGIRDLARDLNKASASLDRVIETMPESVDAGPISQLVQAMVDAAMANVGAIVVRLEQDAEYCGRAADGYQWVEQFNANQMLGIAQNLLAGPVFDKGKLDRATTPDGE